jgi:hypothetical protein
VDLTPAASSLTADVLSGRLERALETLSPVWVAREGGRVLFAGGIFRFVSSWNLLGPITRGWVEVTPTGKGTVVRYKIWFSEMLLGVTLLVAIMGTFMHVWQRPTADTISWLAFMWLWLFGVNLLTTLVRFPRFVRRATVAGHNGG